MMLKKVYWHGRCDDWDMQTLSISVFHLLLSRWAAVFLGKSHKVIASPQNRECSNG